MMSGMSNDCQSHRRESGIFPGVPPLYPVALGRRLEQAQGTGRAVPPHRRRGRNGPRGRGFRLWRVGRGRRGPVGFPETISGHERAGDLIVLWWSADEDGNRLPAKHQGAGGIYVGRRCEWMVVAGVGRLVRRMDWDHEIASSILAPPTWRQKTSA